MTYQELEVLLEGDKDLSSAGEECDSGGGE
jgi:hypothetical protein